MKLIFVALIICLGGCVNTSKNVIPPEGWRVADKEDSINDWVRFDSPNRIVNDFNGDGRADVAQILLNTSSNKGYKFVVDVGSEHKIQQFHLMDSGDVSPQSISIELIEPSEEIWESACEKGYWDCGIDEVRQFKITKPSIYFCYIESACTVFLWSDRNKKFVKIPISD